MRREGQHDFPMTQWINLFEQQICDSALIFFMVRKTDTRHATDGPPKIDGPPEIGAPGPSAKKYVAVDGPPRA